MIPVIEDKMNRTEVETASDIAERLGNEKLKSILFASQDLFDTASAIFDRIRKDESNRNIR